MKKPSDKSPRRTGAQLKDVTMDEAISRLTESINSYLKEAHEK